MRPVLLDTDMLSAVMRKNPAATAQAQVYLSVFRQFTLCIITRYEILRGLRAKGATTQLAAFERFCSKPVENWLKRAAYLTTSSGVR